ncbi:class I SAM-dependent methyltransferase [Mycolicibacterium farcinogenes]|uniref:class I SAM-dependent methyltransferase n=1 Tax=Mycolicibacterium farcinogenes TaxID=1802 RepID=UPI001C8D738F|nr:class I SAM-dependent methyltransferase [Mycolicibacterium farcinogenes]QZH63122.1 class I SAM-dependent methyltransferase [Mycolicibacterium farcinogenes]
MTGLPNTSRPLGAVTRGTTGYNRLRRSDRWLVHSPRVRSVLRAAADPLVVDLGYGALPVTTLELATRLRVIRPDVRVVGLEIHPERVATARAVAGGTGVRFELGGFELAGLRPVLVRAFNVLRQYPVESVPEAWATMSGRLAPGGLIVDGTCDELGRRCCWVLLDESGPVSLTLACDPFSIERPSDLAERLPKVLIHHNVEGQPIHALLGAADRAWASAAGHGVFGPRVRWRAMVELLRAEGFPVDAPRRRLRDGVLTVPWATVAPATDQEQRRR